MPVHWVVHDEISPWGERGVEALWDCGMSNLPLVCGGSDPTGMLIRSSKYRCYDNHTNSANSRNAERGIFTLLGRRVRMSRVLIYIAAKYLLCVKMNSRQQT